jgi:hypothetical protein
MATDVWAEQMRAIAEGEPEEPAPPIRVEWHSLETAIGGHLDWQIVGPGGTVPGRRLLVVELDADAESRVLAAMDVLAGRQG